VTETDSKSKTDTQTLLHGVLRQHQAEGFALARDILNGTFLKKIVVAAVTPGGGKTLLASVFAHALIEAGLIDFVLVIVPREALRQQMVEGFTVPNRNLRRKLASEKSKNATQENLFGTAGLVTTYQAIARGSRRFLRRMKGKRTLVILDEPHHMADGEVDEECMAWKRAVDPIVEAAERVLLMSGTLMRHDGKPIPYVPYDPQTLEAIVDVRYSRRDALRERAIVPLSVRLLDGCAEYEHLHRKHVVHLSEAEGEERGRALRTVLEDPGYRDWVCLEALREWQNYRANVFKSKAIVVCHNQKAAQHIAKLIAHELKVDVALAIDSEKNAHRSIHRFRNGIEGDVLVTVGMAYEGLDVPEATHLICLTNIRSRPWLEQVVNRITRFCMASGLPWEQQWGFLYVPDDKEMRAFIETIMEDQRATYEKNPKIERKPPVYNRSTFKALDASVGEARYADMQGVYSQSESALIERVKVELPRTATWSPREILDLGRRLFGTNAAE
jgi:superfamily II DNA or RNA helicase